MQVPYVGMDHTSRVQWDGDRGSCRETDKTESWRPIPSIWKEVL